MSVSYTHVLWNQQKKAYDRYLWIGIITFIAFYIALQLLIHPTNTVETLIIRSTGLSAVILLHGILLIGPLARINYKFLPLLYNRRHAGVSMFLLAAIHGIFSIIQFHSLGDTSALVSLFTSNENYQSISQFPFQILGFFALIILLFMAATSHDFWLKNLSPSVWKALHMMVYVAYGLVIAHIALGAFQYENHPVNWLILVIGFISVIGLHIYTGFIELKRLSKEKSVAQDADYHKICSTQEIESDRAKTVCINGENIAIFKYDGKLSAVHNVCKHQLGPLGEGKIIDGCITCPWHGYQYLPENGQSPPPFKEKVKTYQLKVINNEVWLNPTPYEEGTFVEPVLIHQA